jgi:hypothetical protein
MTRQERTPVTTFTQTPGGTSSFAARRRSVHPSRTPLGHLNCVSARFDQVSWRPFTRPLRPVISCAGKKPRAELARCQLANPTPHRAEGTQLAPRWRLRPGRRAPRRFSGASVRAVYKPILGVLGRFLRPARRTSTPSGGARRSRAPGRRRCLGTAAPAPHEHAAVRSVRGGGGCRPAGGHLSESGRRGHPGPGSGPHTQQHAPAAHQLRGKFT